MSESQTHETGFGVTADVARWGPTLSIAGLLVWVATIVVFGLVAPADQSLGSAPERSAQIRILVAMIVGGLGTFAGTILSTLGLIFSLANRKHRTGAMPQAGVVLGILGASMLLLVLVLLFVRITN